MSSSGTRGRFREWPIWTYRRVPTHSRARVYVNFPEHARSSTREPRETRRLEPRSKKTSRRILQGTVVGRRLAPARTTAPAATTTATSDSPRFRADAPESQHLTRPLPSRKTLEQDLSLYNISGRTPSRLAWRARSIWSSRSSWPQSSCFSPSSSSSLSFRDEDVFNGIFQRNSPSQSALFQRSSPSLRAPSCGTFEARSGIATTRANNAPLTLSSCGPPLETRLSRDARNCQNPANRR